MTPESALHALLTGGGRGGFRRRPETSAKDFATRPIQRTSFEAQSGGGSVSFWEGPIRTLLRGTCNAGQLEVGRFHKP